jgi:tetratricopeptide (TPR) repeat protein
VAGTLPYGADLHDQLFSEDQEAADAALEIKACLATSDISKALVTCDRMLSLHPESRLFEGLRLEIENREREVRLDFIRQLSAELEREPDLDARIKAIQQALKHYPAESHLIQLLKIATARRDLFNVLVAEARNDEISDKYDDALKCWSLLRELYPSVRGLEGEVHRVESLVDTQRRLKRRAEFVDAIFTLSSTGDYARAVYQCINALAEYPNDAGLLALKASIEEKAAHATELQNFVAEGVTFLQGQELDAALESFNKARTLDQNNLQVRYLIGIALLEKARAMMADDRRKLTLLLEEARAFIPTHSDLRTPTLELHAPAENWESSLVRVPEDPVIAPEPPSPSSAVDPPPAFPDRTPVEAIQLEPAPQTEPPPPLTPPEPQPEPTPWQAAPAAIHTDPPPIRKVLIAGLVILGALLVGWVVYANQPGLEASRAALPINVDIKATPEGSEIFVDGQRLGQSGVKAQIPRGSHTLSATLFGYDPQTLTVDVGAETKSLQIDLQPTPLEMRLATDEATGTVWVDDQLSGDIHEGSVTISGVKPGVRTIRMSLPSGEIEMAFEFSPGQPPVPKSLPSREVANVLFAGNADGKSHVTCNCAPAGLRVGELAELIRPEGLEIPLADGEHPAELWLGKSRKNFTIQGSHLPAATIAVFSVTPVPNP